MVQKRMRLDSFPTAAIEFELDGKPTFFYFGFGPNGAVGPFLSPGLVLKQIEDDQEHLFNQDELNDKFWTNYRRLKSMWITPKCCAGARGYSLWQLDDGNGAYWVLFGPGGVESDFTTASESAAFDMFNDLMERLCLAEQGQVPKGA